MPGSGASSMAAAMAALPMRCSSPPLRFAVGDRVLCKTSATQNARWRRAELPAARPEKRSEARPHHVSVPVTRREDGGSRSAALACVKNARRAI